MPAEPTDQNTLSSSTKDRSTRRGDVPDQLARRYYTDERGGDGLGFYLDARIQAPAFRDRGRELVAARADPNAIRDMVAIAKHRDWTIVTARGSSDFRREAWLVGRAAGLEVRGYRPTERDLQELQRRQAAEQRVELRQERREEKRDRASGQRDVRRERQSDAAVERRLEVVDAVVRARVDNPERQAQIMAAARTRVADWLERGGSFDDGRQTRGREPERQRAR